jgi:hypothetical protein
MKNSHTAFLLGATGSEQGADTASGKITFFEEPLICTVAKEAAEKSRTKCEDDSRSG